jgi:hypothetical protein
VPIKDVFAVIRELRHKPPKSPAGAEDYKKLMIAGSPAVSYNPASGFGIGAAGNVAFYRGFPETTRISSAVASLIVTTKDQLLFNGKLDVSAPNNRWAFHGDNRLYWTSQDTYGLGTSTTPGEAVNAKYNFFRFYESLYRQVRPNLYVGAGFLYNLHGNVRPAEDSASAWPDSPLDHHEERPVRDGGLPQHGDAERRADGRAPVRLVRHRRRPRPAPLDQQGLEDQPLPGLRPRQGRLARRVLRRPGSLLMPQRGAALIFEVRCRNPAP